MWKRLLWGHAPGRITIAEPAPAAPASAAGVQVSGDASPPADWHTTLPEDIRADTTLAKYKTPEDAHRGHLEAVKLIGRKTDGMVRLPTAASTPEEVAAYRKATGVPEGPDKYTFDIAEEFRTLVPEDALKRWGAMFHKEGVPAATAQKLVTAYAMDTAQQRVVLQQTFRAKHDELKEQMGEATYGRFVAKAEEGIGWLQRQLGEEKGAAIKKLFDDTLLGDHPLMVEIFSLVGRTLSEDGHIPVEGVGGGMLDAAKARVMLFVQNKAGPEYTEAQHHADEALIQEYDKNWDFKDHLPGTA